MCHQRWPFPTWMTTENCLHLVVFSHTAHHNSVKKVQGHRRKLWFQFYRSESCCRRIYFTHQNLVTLFLNTKALKATSFINLMSVATFYEFNIHLTQNLSFSLMLIYLMRRMYTWVCQRRGMEWGRRESKGEAFEHMKQHKLVWLPAAQGCSVWKGMKKYELLPLTTIEGTRSKLLECF